jgi:hypothetical protein
MAIHLVFVKPYRKSVRSESNAFHRQPLG